MNTYAFITFCACLALTNAHHLASSAKYIQGPSSRTTLVGPDGSVISAVAPGGQIVHEEHPGYVAHSAPVVAYSSPVVAHGGQIVHEAHPRYVSHSAPVVTYSAPVVAHASPVVAHALPHSTHVSRYGSHINHGAYGAPLAYAAHSPVVGYSGAVVAGLSGVVSSPYGYGHQGVYGGHQGVYGGHHQGLYL